MNSADAVSLRDYFDGCQESLRREFLLAINAVNTHLEASDKAIEVARTGLDKRLEGMNEFRETLRDQTAQFVTRKEFDFLGKDIRELRDSRAKLEGMATAKSVYVAYILCLIGYLFSFAGLAITISRIL